jgi:hypothetical protein
MFFKKNMEYNQQQYLSKIKIQRELTDNTKYFFSAWKRVL